MNGPNKQPIVESWVMRMPGHGCASAVLLLQLNLISAINTKPENIMKSTALSLLRKLSVTLGLLALLSILQPMNSHGQGVLINGAQNFGAIFTNTVDTWTFTANTGDAIVVRMGEMVSGSIFAPNLRLYGPGGALLDSSGGHEAVEVSTRATNNGTFTVLANNCTNCTGSASGTYQLTLAKTGSPIVVSPGDEGGMLINGVMHTGTIDVGDLDVWSFTATNGESIVVQMGEMVSGSTLAPELRLYGPDGVRLGVNGVNAAAQVSAQATNSGTFTVVAANCPNCSAGGSGTYRLTLAKTGSPIVVTPGDEGGTLINGVMHTGTIDVGDLDVWSFTANAGDTIEVRMGEMVSGSTLAPALWLYGPDGVRLDINGQNGVAAVYATATNSGTFTVVAGNCVNCSGGGSGAYRLTLAKTGSPIVVSPGDEGGALINGAMHTGTIDVGDLDVWTFTASAGNTINVVFAELPITNNFASKFRLFGPTGVLITQGGGDPGANISILATNSGTYILVIGDDPGTLAGSGTYQLTVSGISGPATIGNISISGTNLFLSGTSGGSNGTFIVLSSTNMAIPVASWTPVLTNQFNALGEFNVTNLFDFAVPQRFFILSVP